MINPQKCPYSGECDLRVGKECRGLSDTFFRDMVCHFRKIGGVDYKAYAKKMIFNNYEPEEIADVTGLKTYMVYDMKAEMAKNGQGRQRSAGKA